MDERLKPCRRCKQSLPLSAFSPEPRRRDGRRALCRPCNADYVRETSDRERQRAVAKTAEARSRRNERLRARRATDPEWCERERRRARERKYRMRYGMPTTALGDLEGWICYLCCEHVEPADAEPDHIIPESRGGTSDRANLGLTHRHCNRRKQDATVASLEWAHPSAVERERAAIAFALATVSP